MQVIRCLSDDIETTLDCAEECAKNAIKYKESYPIAAKAFYTKSLALMESIKSEHDAVTALIIDYRKDKGEPPVPMMAIYNYLHERHISKAAAIKNLQDMYNK